MPLLCCVQPARHRYTERLRISHHNCSDRWKRRSDTRKRERKKIWSVWKGNSHINCISAFNISMQTNTPKYRGQYQMPVESGSDKNPKIYCMCDLGAQRRAHATATLCARRHAADQLIIIISSLKIYRRELRIAEMAIIKWANHLKKMIPLCIFLLLFLLGLLLLSCSHSRLMPLPVYTFHLFNGRT